MCYEIRTADNSDDMIGSIIALVVHGSVFLTTIWLIVALKKGSAGAWYIQLIQSVLGLLLIPFVTILSVAVLLRWFKPETKAWFRLK